MDYSTKTIAAGCFGKVYKQKFEDSWAALKKVPMDRITEQELKRECAVYEKAQHNNVVRLLGKPWVDDEKWHIPLEFIVGEDLETAIFNVQKSKLQLTPSVKATIITGMCEGLNFLHSKDIVHQDLKPDNIMIEHISNRAVIIDMGLAKFFKNGLSSAVNMGNDAYSAPEIVKYQIRDKRSDVWAMGKIIAELCARIRLHTPSVTPDKINGTLKDNPYRSVVCRMVMENPAERSSMLGVIEDIRQIGVSQKTDTGAVQGAEARRPQVDLGARAAPRGTGSDDFWVRDERRMQSPFQLEVGRMQSPFQLEVGRMQSPFQQEVGRMESRFEQLNLFHQHHAVLPLNATALTNNFMQLGVQTSEQADRTVVQQRTGYKVSQVIKHTRMENGKVESSEFMKFGKF